MAKARMDLTAFAGKLLEEQDVDVLREGIRVLSQALMETEVASLIGAERHERTGERVAYRNGSRTRPWDTRMGTIELAIPKVTPGTYFPSLLQPRRRAEHALLAVVQEAYVHGVSTRKVDALVKALLGVDGISKSEVSRICGALDPVLAAFRTRPLTGGHRYLWVDATYHKVRVDGRVISQATVVAVGVTSEGDRQVLGVDVGPSEDRAFWTAFLRSLVKRGLTGVRLVISDAHEGLQQAISTVLTGSAWQRCRVHFMRNLLATVPHGVREAVAAVVRTIFAQPDHASAMTQLRKVADGLRTRFPRAATVLEEAAEDILAYRHLPLEHQRQLHSTNPLERLNKEIKRRPNVVGIFPNPAAVIRLVGAILLEQDDCRGSDPFGPLRPGKQETLPSQGRRHPMRKEGSAEKVVQDIRRKTRRRFSVEEKIRIVLEGLRGEESIATLCRKEGLAPNLYYRWSKEFLEAGKRRLVGDTTREATSTEVTDLRTENGRLKQLVAEVVLENRLLKKSVTASTLEEGAPCD